MQLQLMELMPGVLDLAVANNTVGAVLCFIVFFFFFVVLLADYICIVPFYSHCVIIRRKSGKASN